jgi:hypothetical protein
MAKIELSVPTSLDDIKLWQYQEYLKVIDEEDEQTLYKKTIELFCGVSLENVDSIPVTEADKVLNVLKNTFEDTPDLIRHFTLLDVEFGFIPKLDEMSLGEYIDLESSITDWQNIHKAMAILYRPVNARIKDKYTIAPYKPNEEVEEIMKEMPLSAAMSSMVFFYRLGIQLSKATLKYTEEALKKEKDNSQLKQLLEKNGVGISQFMVSLKETYLNLMRLPNSLSINA